MKNKKGFTLIELLAVIILLGALAVIIFPNLTTNFEKKKNEIDQATLDILYSSADQYMQKHINDYSGEIGTAYCISLVDIDNEGLIPIDIEDYIDKDIQVKIGKTNSYQITTCEEE